MEQEPTSLAQRVKLRTLREKGGVTSPEYRSIKHEIDNIKNRNFYRLSDDQLQEVIEKMINLTEEITGIYEERTAEPGAEGATEDSESIEDQNSAKGEPSEPAEKSEDAGGEQSKDTETGTESSAENEDEDTAETSTSGES